MKRLLGDVVRLIRSWWCVDRIRLPPQAGRLLRLQPPCYLLIAGRPVEIAARTLGQSGGGRTVTYECRTADGVGRLTVRIVGDSASAAVWALGDVERPIDAEEIEVYMPSARPQRCGAIQ